MDVSGNRILVPGKSDGRCAEVGTRPDARGTKGGMQLDGADKAVLRGLSPLGADLNRVLLLCAGAGVDTKR